MARSLATARTRDKTVAKGSAVGNCVGMRYIAFIIALCAAGTGSAHSPNFSTQAVLDGYLDGYEGDSLYAGYVSGVISGIFMYNAASERTFGKALICVGTTEVSAQDSIAIIRGEIAKMDNSQRQKTLGVSFRAVALTFLVKTFPCE